MNDLCDIHSIAQRESWMSHDTYDWMSHDTYDLRVMWYTYHVIYTVSLNNLAILHRRIGNYKQAIPLYEKSLAIRQRSLGEIHTLQHAATRCNTLQHAATHYNALQHTATHCNTLQHTATHCNAL